MTTKQATSSGKKRKIVNVHSLDGDQHVVFVDVKSKFQEVFNQIAGHLSLRETEYFGLAFKKDSEYHFIILDEKIHKLAPKQWKSGSGEGVDSQGKPLINVWFRVQFYVDQVILLREKVTRHQYYLQLKDNVLHYNHLYNEEKCFQLAAYALQADHGNYIEEKHKDGYFSPANYFPTWMLERHGVEYLAKSTPVIHQDLHNMTRNEAELRYIRSSSLPPGAHNLHFYTVRKRKTDKTCNTWLAVCAKGVDVYEDDAGYKNHISTFLWRDIGKLYFDKKRFEIRSIQSAGGRRFMYYTDCDIKSKYLLNICRSTHIFQMAIQPKLMEIQHLDNEDQKRYRESYIYSDGRDRSYFHHYPSPSKSVSGSSSNNNQRFSVISDASSNTTSGIVSDRNAVSFDDGEEHSREIMIDCPPRGAVYGTPIQSRSKFHLLSSLHSFRPSRKGSKTSPGRIPHPLDLSKPDVTCGTSPSELSPTSSNGSWRARHSENAACLIGGPVPLPSPTTPTHEGSTLSNLRRSLGRKESFSKQILLSSTDRNTSGDSAVSLTGIFSGPDKMAPLSLPHGEMVGISASSSQGSPVSISGPPSGRLSSTGGSPNISLTLSHLKKRSGPSPPSSLSFTPPTPVRDPSPMLHGSRSFGRRQDLEGVDFYKFKSSPIETHPHYKPLSSPREIGEKMGALGLPRRGSIPLGDVGEHFKPLSSPSESSKPVKVLGSPRDAINEQLDKLQASPRGGIHDLRVVHDQNIDPLYTLPSSQSLQIPQSQGMSEASSMMVYSASEPYGLKSSDHKLPDHNSNLPLYGVGPIGQYNQQQQQLLLQHQLHQQQHQQNHPQPPPSTSKKASPITEHYLLALQSSPRLPEQLSSPRGRVPDRDHLTGHGGFSRVNEELLNEQYRQYQLQQQQYHQDMWQRKKEEEQVLQQHQQQLPMDSLASTDQNLPSYTRAKTAEGNKDKEENKENLHHEAVEEREEANPGDEVKEDTRASRKPSRHHPKGVLHPELKQILGQSQAISLPLITALCNDSSLMQASRSQSGSRSSYDTSTVRSTDSRLTRFSHDTDPRRWSSCCQAAGATDTMVSVQSSRPYSWHSEHFELDAQLALPPTDHLNLTSPPNPRAVKKHCGNILENVSNVPQKMIESDPGPSSPRMINTGQVSWWDFPHSAIGSEPGSTTSWADVIPYNFSSQLSNKHSGSMSGSSQQSNQSHQHMVPHKLSSGGHRDSDSSLAHKQMMKENIGIA